MKITELSVNHFYLGGPKCPICGNELRKDRNIYTHDKCLKMSTTLSECSPSGGYAEMITTVKF